jgi:DNA modification methylase
MTRSGYNPTTMQPIAAYINRVIHGDCIEVMRTMPSSSIDFILTDPPYIVRYASRDGRTIAEDDNGRWLTPAFAECYRVLKQDRYAVSFYGWNQVHRFMDKPCHDLVYILGAFSRL